MKKCDVKIFFIFFAIFITAFILYFFRPREIQLSEYKPKNQDEAEIITLLIQYQDAKNRFNLNAFLACLHEQGQYSFKGASMVSMETLKESLPDFWANLQNENRYVLYPITHEFVTGDFYISGQLINPQIVISGDTADVTVKFISGWWRQKHYIGMARVDHQWLIIRLEWEEA